MNNPNKTAEEMYREQVGNASKELFTALYDLAKAYVELERVRKDRTGPPEHVSDAAQAYRAAERTAQKKSDELVTLHCHMLNRDNLPHQD